MLRHICFRWMAPLLATVPALASPGCFSSSEPAGQANDPYLWLEDVEGGKALGWVRARNEEAQQRLESDPRFATFRKEAEAIVQDRERIPYGRMRGGYVYNFWQDEKHVRGIWRRTKLKDYLQKDPAWELLLDVDALAEKEKENWVFKGSECLPPDGGKCLLKLSRGGKDAVVVREFDVEKREFVKGGFEVPEAKNRVTWVDADTIVVGSDWGEGSLTDSGYPRVLKRWKRGTPLAAAETAFEGEKKDVSAWYFRSVRPEGSVGVFGRSVTFYESAYFLEKPDGRRERIPLPEDASLEAVFHGRVVFLLRSTWKGHERGTLLAMDLKDFSRVEALFAPDERTSVAGVATTASRIYVNLLQNVQGKVIRLTPPAAAGGVAKAGHATRARRAGKWLREEIRLPANGAAGISDTSSFGEDVFFSYESFLVPESQFHLDGKAGALEPVTVRARRKLFDSDGLESTQFEARSRDGERIPYFVVRKKPAQGKEAEPSPTLLYGYGGFEVSMSPYYSGVVGKLWLERGGSYVVANIRGGGEFGPRWHQAALKENRQKAFDDFIAVAEDLIGRGLATPKTLGIAGGSNGGLLVGATFTQRPELFNAVICQVPLLDMLRYHKLLAGASWMAEYGDPDEPKMREVILRYSPYHHLKKSQKYPEVFFYTSTKDDRVHPGHARKMVARMKELGHPVLYFENIEGGHGGAANLVQHARRYALEYVYLHQKLGGRKP